MVFSWSIRGKKADEGGAMIGEGLPTPDGATTLPVGWILVIASHAHMRDLLLRVLNMAGYTALGCATLDEAESVLRRSSLPHLILFDVAEASEEALPQRLQQLYTLLPLEEVMCPIVVLSAMHPSPRSQFLPGRVRVVAKPFNLAHLLHLVASQTTSLQE
jgi:DNA-binding response OmpR family regulator